VLVQHIRNLGKPGPIFALLDNLQRGKILHAVRRRVSQRLEETCRDKNRHIMRLTVHDPSRLFRRQASRQLPKQR
jgi:hypothetical protein